MSGAEHNQTAGLEVGRSRPGIGQRRFTLGQGRYIDDLPSVAQWDIAQACGGEWPEVLLIGCADIALLMADAFQTMPGDGVDWIWAEPTEALTDLVPIIVTLGITVPASLLAFEGDGALR